MHVENHTFDKSENQAYKCLLLFKRKNETFINRIFESL